MSLTDRDRKVLLVLLPAVLAAAYWFLVLSPKRQEAAKLGETLQKVEKGRDDARSRAATLENARSTYAEDYAAVVRVGKAVPGSLDMPSLIVQLDEAAEGTGIRFKRITTGERTDAPAPTPPTPSSGGSVSAPGQARDAANGAAQTSEQRPETSGAAPPSGAPAAGATGTSGVSGLDSVPLEFTFSGSFFDLADFFHAMKRFVRVAGDKVRVRGRLLTIDGFTFESSAFPKLTADIQATVYLAPKSEGTTAGATPSGPAPTTEPASGAQPGAPPATPPSGAPAPATSTGGVQ